MGADTRACVMCSTKVSGPLGTPWSVSMESALNAWVGVPACRHHPRAARDDGDFGVRCAGWPAPHVMAAELRQRHSATTVESLEPIKMLPVGRAKAEMR
jgi:hypothetical protein